MTAGQAKRGRKHQSCRCGDPNPHNIQWRRMTIWRRVSATWPRSPRTRNNNTPCSRKKGDSKLMAVTLLILNRFSHFFHRQILQRICSTVFIKDPTAPYTRRYTTSWNITVRKWAISQTNAVINDKLLGLGTVEQNACLSAPPIKVSFLKSKMADGRYAWETHSAIGRFSRWRLSVILEFWNWNS